jgi:hypothetical protein
MAALPACPELESVSSKSGQEAHRTTEEVAHYPLSDISLAKSLAMGATLPVIRRYRAVTHITLGCELLHIRPTKPVLGYCWRRRTQPGFAIRTEWRTLRVLGVAELSKQP